jgi:hypothetical protein
MLKFGKMKNPPVSDRRVFQNKGDAEAPPADRQAGHVRELEEEERSSGLFMIQNWPPGGRRRRMTNHSQIMQLLPFGIRVNNRFASVFVERVYRLFLKRV